LSIIFQRAFWLNLAGASITAIVAATPILSNSVMDRGFEIAKQCVAEPLAVLALGAVVLALGWRWILRRGAPTRIAAGSLVVFLFLAVASAALSENVEVAIFGGYYRREGLLAWGTYGAFFVALLGWARAAGRVGGFLDVLLLASVVPASYALQQRLDLDFFPVGVHELARPGGFLGNPLFLGAYLGLLLPVTAVRCWSVRGNRRALALWLAVFALQAGGLLIAQSRGPLLASFAGLLLVACFAAAYARARSIFLGSVLALALATVALISINTLPSAKHWAQDVAVVSRLVFNTGRDAGADTQRASSSAAARLAIWGAGIETFAVAPLGNKLLGYGPETAYMHYFSHLPASVMRAVGYGAYHTYDRMHADALDIGLNFGVLAWFAYCMFFGAVMFAAARALFGIDAKASRWIFVASATLGGAISAIAAVRAGLAAAAVPAFGLGIGAGWFLFMAGCAWRAITLGLPATAALQPGRWVLLSGLVSSLLVFWVDAQVNIPVLATRLISFAIAALILVVADDIARDDASGGESKSAANDDLWVWGIGICMTATLASCLPVTLLDTSMSTQAAHWLRRAVPVVALVCAAVFYGWQRARRGGVAVRAWFLIAGGLPLLYGVCLYALAVLPDSSVDFGQVRTISIASCAGAAFIFTMCIACARYEGKRAAPAVDAQPFSKLARWSVGAVAIPVLLVANLNWRAVHADVASALAHQAAAKQPQLGEQFIAEAIRLMPHERYYRRQLVFDLLGGAIADIRVLDQAPERIPVVMRKLAYAESAARAAAMRFPRDPWVIAALANVLQVHALRLIRPLDAEGGLRAALEANQLFAQAHLMFPSEPLLLRNWAQLLFDQGNAADAYRLLDRMEKLIPNDLEPYAERIVMAKQTHDYITIKKTLARASVTLEPRDFDQLSIVARQQQN
jgi:hypothetical protein